MTVYTSVCLSVSLTIYNFSSLLVFGLYGVELLKMIFFFFFSFGLFLKKNYNEGNIKNKYKKNNK